MMKTIKDALIFVKDQDEPFLGSVSFSSLTTPEMPIIIKAGNNEIAVPISKIEFLIFKGDDKRFGIICKSKFYIDDEHAKYWNNATRKVTQALAGRDLERCIN